MLTIASELLRRPGIPDAAALSASFERLTAYSRPAGIPGPGSPAEWDVFAAASVMLVNSGRAAPARRPLQAALGGATSELLTAYLAVVRTANY